MILCRAHKSVLSVFAAAFTICCVVSLLFTSKAVLQARATTILDSAARKSVATNVTIPSPSPVPYLVVIKRVKDVLKELVLILSHPWPTLI